MKYKVILGIDVGKSGGIVAIDAVTKKIIHIDKTPLDEDGEAYPEGHLKLLSRYTDMEAFAVVEKVTGRYGDSAHSAFNFGLTAGIMRSSVVACYIDYSLVHPKTWMKHYKMSRTKDEDGTVWKNRLKSLALELYPDSKPTLWSADAILLAHYGLMVLNK